MEQNQNTSLFELTINNESRMQLSEAARWARFLAIAGFIVLVLMIIYGIIFSLMFSSMVNTMGEGFGGNYPARELGTGFGVGMIFIYIIAAIIAFIPLLFLLRFSNKMRTALNSNDQEILNDSFRYLKVYYRYIGILTIIGLCLFAFSILMILVSGSMMM